MTDLPTTTHITARKPGATGNKSHVEQRRVRETHLENSNASKRGSNLGDKRILERMPLYNFTIHSLGTARRPLCHGAITRYGTHPSKSGLADGETGSSVPLQHAAYVPAVAWQQAMINYSWPCCPFRPKDQRNSGIIPPEQRSCFTDSQTSSP